MLGLSAAEFAFWLDYRERHGFELDRLEAVAANGHGYVGAVSGAGLGFNTAIFGPPRQYGLTLRYRLGE